MKLKIWIEIHPWQIGQNGELRDDNLPLITAIRPSYTLASGGQRFSVIIDIPYEFEPVKEIGGITAEMEI